MVKLNRLNENNPVLTPRRGVEWESNGVCNAGAIKQGGKIYLLYRAHDRKMQSSFGLATSTDGILFERSMLSPAFTKQDEVEYEKDGIENPRITLIDNAITILYTAAARYDFPGQTPDHKWKTAVCKAVTQDFITYKRQGIVLDSGQDKDAALFPEKINNYYYMYHRSQELNIGLSRSIDLKTWEAISPSVITKTEYNWENERVSIGPPPIKTETGWLCFYHGRNIDGIYSISAFLADKQDPTQIVGRLNYPLLQPEMDYEKQGTFPNIVYTNGAVELGSDIYVYYGCADYSIGLAKINTHQLLQELVT